MIGSGRASHRKRMRIADSTQPWRALRKCPLNFNSRRCTKACVSILATRSARAVDKSSAQRGRGERRMPVAPAASCALGSGRTHTSNNEYPESPGVPARNGFNGFLRALPGDRALLPPSPCGLKVLSSPVEPNEPPQHLTPASRRQDHTTSPSASSAVVLHAANRSRRAIRPALASHAQHCCVHRTPPRVRDDHDTPLWWGGMREF